MQHEKMQHETIQHGKFNTKKYNTRVQREVELSSSQLSMMETVPKQQSVEIFPITFHNGDPVDVQLENTGKILVA